MNGIDVRKWLWRIAVFIAIGFIVYPALQSKGATAIRPNESQIQDVLLLKAIKQYADEVDVKRGDPKPRMHLGMTYEAAAVFSLAEATYQQLVDQFPDMMVGWYRLAIVQERQGNLEQGIQTLRHAAELAGTTMDVPHWQLALWLIDVGSLEEAKQSLSIAASINPDSVPLQIARARIAIEEDKPDIAIDILTNPSLIRNVPDGYTYQLLGRSYRANGDIEKAREAWSRASQTENERNDHRYIDLLSASVEKHAFGLRGLRKQINRYLNEGDLAGTRKLIEEYFALDANNTVVRRLDAICDFKQGDLESALHKLTKLIEKDPLDTKSMIYLATVRMQTPKYFNHAEFVVTGELLETVVKINPTNTRAHFLLAEVLNKITKPKLAIFHYKESLRLDPTYRESLQGVLNAIAIVGNWDEHEDLVQKGLMEMPNHPALQQRSRGEE